MKTYLSPYCDLCWVSHICWHIECSIFTASSFMIWNSSAEILSSPLALFIVMLPKAHLILHSKMSGSRWVTTPSWLSGPLRSFLYSSYLSEGFPCGSAGKESTCNVGDLGSIPGLGRSPGEGNGNPLQYSGLENSTDCPWDCKESDMTEQLSLHSVLSLFSRVQLFAILLDCSPPDSSVPFPPPGNLPNSGVETTSPVSPASQGGFFASEPWTTDFK